MNSEPNINSRNYNFYFSTSRQFISNNINIPNNIMYGHDYFMNMDKSNSLTGISLNNPNILSFIDYQRFLYPDESNLNSKLDYYVYQNIERLTNYENSLIKESTSTLNLTLAQKQEKDRIDKILYSLNTTLGIDPNNYFSNGLITTYLPFVGNCKFLGSHISFRDLMKNSNCSLTSNSVKYTFYCFSKLFKIYIFICN